MLEHKHLIVKASVANPPIGQEKIKFVDNWVRELVALLNMEIMLGPYTAYSEMVGNRGMTTVCVITTSHIAMHTWDEEEPGTIQLDIYTCSCLDVDVIKKHFECFEPINISYSVIDRQSESLLIQEQFNVQNIEYSVASTLNCKCN